MSTTRPGAAAALPPAAGRSRVRQFGARRALPDPAVLGRRRLAVTALKRILPALALAALGLILLWPELAGMEDRVRFAYRKPDGAAAEAARLVAPRYRGRDERGRPFELAAAAAEQAPGSPVIALAQPTGEVTLEDGAWVTLAARRGWYERDRNRLDLEGEVTLLHDAGYAIRTERARIDLGLGRAEGDAPVAAQGPPGTVEGAGFRLEGRGAVVVFTGPARMVLVPGEAAP